MEHVTYDSFSWAVETAYKLEDGTIENELEPFIGPDGLVRNGDGSAFSPVKEADPDAPKREVIQRTLILTVASIAQGPGGLALAVPTKTIRFGFANPGSGQLPAWERLAISMRGEVPPAQVLTAPASALGGVELGGGVKLPPGLADRLRGK